MTYFNLVISAVVRLSHVVRRPRHSGNIRTCCVGLLAVGLAGLAPQAVAQSFPATFELGSLAGGDGTEGFVLNGIEGEWSGSAVSGAGDINGDGIEDFIIGALFSLAVAAPTPAGATWSSAARQAFPPPSS